MAKNPAPFGDNQKQQFIAAIALMLEAQLAAAGTNKIAENLELRALGYIYGFIDAALRTIGQDMADVSIGIPITFQVLRRLFPGEEHEYLAFVRENIRRDAVMMSAVMYGGQQYIDFNNGKLKGPMGLARTLLGAGPP